ncbi:MAG: hypothetical protein ACREQM_19980 [Candidatus Dormibacteraceae bacterium]
MQERTDRLLRVLDLAGTFVFAIEGGLAGAEAHLDLLGSPCSRSARRSAAGSSATS